MFGKEAARRCSSWKVRSSFANLSASTCQSFAAPRTWRERIWTFSSENDARYQMIVSVPFRRASRFLLRCVAFSICVAVIWSIRVCAAEAFIHPGFSNLPDSIADRGELLLGELNCIACHQTDAATKARLAPKQAPVLSQEAITPQYLGKFLLNPQSEKPGSAMPDLLHGMD